MPMASTTKIMTALTAVRLADPAAETVIRPEWTGAEGSSMYLRAGETYTLDELLKGMLLVSGNDAALAVAGTAAGDVETFVDEMNRLAGEMGLRHTHFTNPNGLPDKEHYSCASDLAAIMAAAMQEPYLREALSTKSESIHNITYVNHNKLLWQCPGVNGGKTGYTKSAGRCLVSSCERSGMELICVTLSDPDDWDDHAALYDWAFSAYHSQCFSASDVMTEVPVISGSLAKAGTALAEDIFFCLPAGETAEAALHVPDFVFAPVKAGDTAGECVFSLDGKEIGRASLVWTVGVSRVLSVRPGLSHPVGTFIGYNLI